MKKIDCKDMISGKRYKCIAKNVNGDPTPGELIRFGTSVATVYYLESDAFDGRRTFTENAMKLLVDNEIVKVFDVGRNEIEMIEMEETGKKLVKVKYFDKNLPPVVVTDKGDCVDLRASWVQLVDVVNNHHRGLTTPFRYSKGDVLLIGLGVGMRLPDGYRINLFSRSGAFKNYGFILTNGVGVIDNSYCGIDDEFKAMVYCTRDGQLEYGDRLFQIEIVPVTVREFDFIEVPEFDMPSRGGYGSSGVK